MATQPSTVLFGISTLLIFIHIIYAGCSIFKKEKHVDIFIFIVASLICGFLAVLVKTIPYPLLWFFCLQAIFFSAILFHCYYKSKTSQPYLKEFCNYKIYIEIYGIILSCVGILFYSLFHLHTAFLGALTLIFIIKLNYSIFKKKRIYGIYYQPPEIAQMPLVSIVVIAYNEEKYIERLLASIAAQDYAKYEIILVDDHSSDKTVEIARKFELKLPLQIVQKDIRGASRSRNYGASFAKGEVILFLDADVTLPADFINSNIKPFIEQKLSIAGVDFITESNSRIDKLITALYRTWLKLVQYFNPRGIGFCLFACEELHKKVLFDETVVMSEDFDYVKRAVQYGKFRIIDKVPVKVSWRRFHQENRFLLIVKYMFFEWYRQNIGEIRTKLLPYEFGNSNSL